MEGVDVAYYLFHSMSDDRHDFTRSDRLAAERFGNAARGAGIKRIVFLGGLGVDGAKLSRHLRSRHEVVTEAAAEAGSAAAEPVRAPA